eukprot:2690781-Rhodomonas_salina.3
MHLVAAKERALLVQEHPSSVGPGLVVLEHHPARQPAQGPVHQGERPACGASAVAAEQSCGAREQCVSAHGHCPADLPRRVVAG